MMGLDKDMNDTYILKGKKPVPEPDLSAWGRWMGELKNKIIAKDQIGVAYVSTVFLGLDHSFSRKGPPILFETMVFGGKHNEEMERYATYEEAEEGHKRWVEKVKESRGEKR